jgi:hypothetical protein
MKGFFFYVTLWKSAARQSSHPDLKKSECVSGSEHSNSVFTYLNYTNPL